MRQHINWVYLHFVIKTYFSLCLIILHTIYMSFLQQWMVQQIGKSGCYVLLPTKIIVLKMNANNCMCSTMYLRNTNKENGLSSIFSCTWGSKLSSSKNLSAVSDYLNIRYICSGDPKNMLHKGFLQMINTQSKVIGCKINS